MKKGLLFQFLLFLVFSMQAQDHVPGHVLVQFRYGINPDSILSRADMDRNQMTKDHCVSGSWNIWLFKTTPGNEDNVMSFFNQKNEVEAVQLNYYAKPRRVIPNDSLFTVQWNMYNTGQDECGQYGTAGIDINVTNAWATTTGGYTALGDTIVIAIVDGGVDLTHPDLNLWKNTREIPDNGIDDDHNGYIDDYNGWNGAYHDDQIPEDPHGTHVAGIAAAIGNNNIGVSGVNWGVKIMPLALVNYTDDEIIEDYTYVFNQRRDYNQSNGTKGTFVVVTNSSFGIDYGQPSQHPMWCAMYDSLGSVGILSAAATTNNDVDVDQVGDMPTTCPSNYLVAVTDMMNNGKKNPSAGFGAINIDLDAPGTCITSTEPDSSYGVMSGTSMASPHVAGAIALLYAAGCANFMQACRNNPASAALFVKQFILAGVDTTSDMLGNSVSGGRLDVYNSMELLINQFCDSCMTLTVSSQPVTCYGDNSGSVAVSITKGTPPYKILWSTGDTTAQVMGLIAGSYSVKVVDSLNCTKFASVTLTQPEPLLAGYRVTEPSNGNDSGGVIVTEVVGGVAPYTFQWSNGDTSQDLKGIAEGTYYVTITDSNNCSREDTIVLYLSGISNVLSRQVQLYPNPTTGDALVEVPEALVGSVAEVIDMPGQVVWSGRLDVPKYILPLAGLQKGVYFLRINNGAGTVVKKIVRL